VTFGTIPREPMLSTSCFGCGRRGVKLRTGVGGHHFRQHPPRELLGVTRDVAKGHKLAVRRDGRGGCTWTMSRKARPPSSPSRKVILPKLA
jgi:hypothetical protein